MIWLKKVKGLHGKEVKRLPGKLILADEDYIVTGPEAPAIVAVAAIASFLIGCFFSVTGSRLIRTCLRSRG